MHAKRVVGLMVGLALLMGCAAPYDRVDAAGAKPAARLDGRRVVLVAMPQDDGSGSLGPEQTVALRMAVAFARHAKRVDMAPGNVRDLAVLLRIARKDRAGYVAVPVVSTWAEGTRWLAPERQSIGIAIFDVSSGQKIASAPLVRSGPAVDFVSTANQSPSVRLIEDYLDGLY